MALAKLLIVSLFTILVVNALPFQGPLQIDYEFSPIDIETIKAFEAFAGDAKDWKSKNSQESSKKLVHDFMKNNSVPGLAVAVMKNGSLQWSEGFGMTDLENRVKTHKDAVWRLASISKALTSGLIAHLLENKLLDLDKPISNFIPLKVLPAKTWQKKPVTITLRQIMSHTAGFRFTQLDDWTQKVFEAKNLSESVAMFKDSPLLFEPGKNFSYSNYGYQLVGMAIEQVLTKKGIGTYEQAINKLFNKLGLATTQAERRGRIIPRRARYYIKLGDNLTNTHIIDDLVAHEGWWPAGGIVSSASDLAKFGDEMLKSYKGNGFLKKATVEQLWNPIVKEPFGFRGMGYGLGWFAVNFTRMGIDKQLGLTRMYGHGGNLLGATTHLGVFPDQDIVVAVFSNLGYTRELDLLMYYIAKNFV